MSSVPRIHPQIRLSTVSDRRGDAMQSFNSPQTPPSTLPAPCLQERCSSASEARQRDQFPPSNCTSDPLTKPHNRKAFPPTMHPLFPVPHPQPPSPARIPLQLNSPHPTALACACDLLSPLRLPTWAGNLVEAMCALIATPTFPAAAQPPRAPRKLAFFLLLSCPPPPPPCARRTAAVASRRRLDARM